MNNSILMENTKTYSIELHFKKIKFVLLMILCSCDPLYSIVLVVVSCFLHVFTFCCDQLPWSKVQLCMRYTHFGAGNITSNYQTLWERLFGSFYWIEDKNTSNRTICEWKPLAACALCNESKEIASYQFN